MSASLVELLKNGGSVKEVIEKIDGDTTINLKESGIGANGAAALGEALKVNQTVTNINLRENKIGDEGAQAIAEALKVNQTVTTINLEGNEIGAEGAAAIGEALKVNQTVTNINLVANGIGDEGAVAIGEALKVNQTVTNIILRGNKIGAEGSALIGEALKANPTVIGIDVSGNEIGDKGAEMICKALEINQAVAFINLGNNGIGDLGCVAVGDLLQQSRSLLEISLCDNHISEKGGERIARSLVHNSTLTSIDLEDTDVYQALNKFAEALSKNYTLISFEYSMPDLDDAFSANEIDKHLARNQEAVTKLICAVRDGQDKAFHLALRRGVSPNASSPSNLQDFSEPSSAIDIAFKSEKSDMIGSLLPHLHFINEEHKDFFSRWFSTLLRNFPTNITWRPCFPRFQTILVQIFEEELIKSFRKVEQISFLGQGLEQTSGPAFIFENWSSLQRISISSVNRMDPNQREPFILFGDRNSRPPVRSLLLSFIHGFDAPRLDVLSLLSELVLNDCDLVNNFWGCLWNCVQLVELVVSSNPGLTFIPAEIQSLRRLKLFDARCCSLERVPKELAFINQLKKCDLSDNKLGSIPTALGAADHIKELYLYGNESLAPPNLFKIDVPREDVIRFHEDLIEKGVTRNQFKLVILGHEAVGKTTIVRCLRAWRGTKSGRVTTLRKGKAGERRVAKFFAHSKKNLPDHNNSTDGIDFGEIELPLPARRSDDRFVGITKLRANVYDFAGQQMYMSTHVFFLSSQTVYMVCFDASKEDTQARVQYWLDCIRSVVGDLANCQILLVATHLDKINENVVEMFTSTLVSKLVARYGSRFHIVSSDIVGVSCKTGVGFDSLVDSLVEKALHLKGVIGVRLPKPWVELEKSLSTIAKKHANFPLVRYSVDWAEIARSFYLSGVNNLKLATGYLDSLGSVIWRPKASGLRDWIVLDPKWLAKLFKTVVSPMKGQLLTKQFMYKKLRSVNVETWGGKEGSYPDSMHGILLSFLGRIGLLIPMNASAHRVIAQESTATRDSVPLDAEFFAPVLCFACKDRSCDGFLGPDGCSRKVEKNCHKERDPPPEKELSNTNHILRRLYILRFVPRDLFGRLCARLLHLQGSLFDVRLNAGWIEIHVKTKIGEGQSVIDVKSVIVVHDSANCIEVTVWQVSSRSDLVASLLRQCISDILASLKFYQNLEYDVIIICPDCAKDKTIDDIKHEAIKVHPSFAPIGHAASVLSASMNALRLSDSGAVTPSLRSASEIVLSSGVNVQGRGCIPFQKAFSAWERGEEELVCGRSGSRVQIRTHLPDVVREDLDHVVVGQLLLISDRELGKGSFGSVKKGKLNRMPVAVKELTLRRSKAKSSVVKAVQDFVHEVSLMAGLGHPNLIRLLATASLKGETSASLIVSELMAGGSLWDRLRENELPWLFRLRVALDVANGLKCLHQSFETSTGSAHHFRHGAIAHRDLRSPNIFLVSPDCVDFNAPVVAKIGDFGMATHVSVQVYMDAGDFIPNQAPQWLAPEILQGQSYDERVDLYSFGIVLWELCAAPLAPFHEFDRTIIREKVLEGIRPSWADLTKTVENSDIIECLKSVSEKLWSVDPDDRTSASICHGRLEEQCNLLKVGPRNDYDYDSLLRVMKEKTSTKVIDSLFQSLDSLIVSDNKAVEQVHLVMEGEARKREARGLNDFWASRGKIDNFIMFPITVSSEMEKVAVTGKRGRLEDTVLGASNACKNVKSIFNARCRKGLSYTIVSTQAGASPRLLCRFFARLEQLKQDQGQYPDVDLLFHYTKPQLLPVLCHTGMNSSYAKGGWFGAGHYFSMLPEYALEGYAYREWRVLIEKTKRELCRLAVRFRKGTPREAYLFREGGECIPVDPWRRLRPFSDGFSVALDWDTGPTENWLKQARSRDEPVAKDESVVIPVRPSMVAGKDAKPTPLQSGFKLIEEVNMKRDQLDMFDSFGEPYFLERHSILAVNSNDEKHAVAVMEILYQKGYLVAAVRGSVDPSASGVLDDCLSNVTGSSRCQCDHKHVKWVAVPPWMRLRVSGDDKVVLWPSKYPLCQDVWPFRDLRTRGFYDQASGGGFKTIPSAIQTLQQKPLVPQKPVMPHVQKEDAKFNEKLTIDSEADPRPLYAPGRTDWRCRTLACLVIRGESKNVRRSEIQDKICSVDNCGGPSDHLTHSVVIERKCAGACNQVRGRGHFQDYQWQQGDGKSHCNQCLGFGVDKETTVHELSSFREVVVPVRERDENGRDWKCDAQVLPRFIIEFKVNSSDSLDIAGVGDTL